MIKSLDTVYRQKCSIAHLLYRYRTVCDLINSKLYRDVFRQLRTFIFPCIGKFLTSQLFHFFVYETNETVCIIPAADGIRSDSLLKNNCTFQQKLIAGFAPEGIIVQLEIFQV